MRQWLIRRFIPLLLFFLETGVFAADSLPLLRKLFGSASFGESRFRETIAKLNNYEEHAFVEAYRTETTWAFYSNKKNSSCWLRHHESDEYADRLSRELAEFRMPVFRYGNWVGNCTAGDTEKLASQIRYILLGTGEWRE